MNLEQQNVNNQLLDVWESKEYIRDFNEGVVPVVVIDLIIPHLRNNAVIIEVGCGNGGKLERLCQINREALGIGLDLSASSLRCAKSKSQLLFIKSTGESLPLEDNVADITVSMYALEHLTNPEQVISEMLRITKKDGVLLFLAPNYGSPIFPSPCNKKTSFVALSLQCPFTWQDHLTLIGQVLLLG